MQWGTHQYGNPRQRQVHLNLASSVHQQDHVVVLRGVPDKRGSRDGKLGEVPSHGMEGRGYAVCGHGGPVFRPASHLGEVERRHDGMANGRTER